MAPHPAPDGRGTTGNAPGRLLYALIGLPLGLLGLAYVAVTVIVGCALSLTVIGLPLLGGGVRAARRVGALHRGPAGRLLRVETAGPTRPRRSTAFPHWARSGV